MLQQCSKHESQLSARNRLDSNCSYVAADMGVKPLFHNARNKSFCVYNSLRVASLICLGLSQVLQPKSSAMSWLVIGAQSVSHILRDSISFFDCPRILNQSFSCLSSDSLIRSSSGKGVLVSERNTYRLLQSSFLRFISKESV